MSRRGRLTIKNSLGRQPVTSGDVGFENDNTITAINATRYLYTQTGLSVLFNRTEEALRSIGIAPIANAGGLFNNDAIRAEYGGQNPTVVPAVIGNPLYMRIYRMAEILINLRGSFRQSVLRLQQEGFNRAQSLDKATEQFIMLFKENLKIVELIEPDVLAFSYIQRQIQDDASTKELMSYLTYQ